MSKPNLEKSEIWKQAMALGRATEQFIEQLPRSESYSLCDQLHRMGISLPADIAMAIGKGDKDGLYDYGYARGHLLTIKSFVVTAKEYGYVKNIDSISVEIESVKRLLDAKIAEIEDAQEESAK